ncbi:unnamed protein product [Schistosoma margrebowiei]|uniref:Rac guanyl-nucleotide exchange factor n=1 Tax=Schistosoma margrebowiei TaxID=48269 RepID=A0AA84ZYD0_9TREM|nr:unnamed protein product [Schistosoma margrebowiei]
MSIHIFPTQCGVDPSGSEISTTDSLIQEFQEFEAQVYSGALFEQKCKTSTPSHENINSLPSQMINIPTIKLDPCSRGTCAKQQLENCGPNEVSDVELDSLDDEPVNSTVQINASSKTNVDIFGSKDSDSFSNRAKLSRIPQLIRSPNRSLSQSTISNNQEATKNITSTISSRHSLPSQMEFPVLQSSANTTMTTNKHHVSNSDFIKVKSSGSNQYFVPNLLTTPNVTESNQNFHLKTSLSYPTSSQSSLSFDSMNNSRSCNKSRVQVTVKKLNSSSPSINNLDLSNLNKINMDSIASYAHEDPIETHDLVVAKMAADGVVWVPSSDANHSTVNSTIAEKNEVHQSILQKTDQLRWYSEEIEEEKINDNPIGRSNSITESHNSIKHNSPTIHNNRTIDNNVNETHSEIAQSSNVHCRSSFSSMQKVFNSSNCNFKDSQVDTPESSSKQVELEAKLEEAMIIRKQQDDYIKQLQMYYDNLLTKHALAEVTIDQLRMGIRVGIDVNNPSDTPSKNVSNKPRSHSMQTLHSNINNRRVSDVGYPQVNSGYHQTRNNSSNNNNNNLHYSSTPLLEQQKNRLKRNASTHDTRTLSVTSDSWETGLGSISNSSQLHRQKDMPNINNYDNQQSICHSQDRITTSSNNPILGQKHFKKSSDPSLCSGDDASRFLNDPMKTSINSRRNTIANSCSPAQQHKQQNQMNLSSSSNRNHISSVLESHHGCNKNEVIIDEEEFDSTLTNINHISNQNKQPDCSKDPVDTIQHSQKAISTVAAPLVNGTPDLDDDMVCGPEAIQMELLLRVADLQTRLSTMELYANEHRFIPDADLVTMQLDYGTLKNYYDLAKVRWGKDPQFDVNKVLIGEINHMGSQLDKLGSYVLNSGETISSPSSTNSSSPAPLPTPQPTSMSISDLPVNWKDLNIFKNSSRIPSGENKPVKNTTDSGVLSSPSSLPSRSDHGRLSSVSPLHSPIVEDSLSELESVYIELMQHYNKIKQLPMTTLRAEQLYNLMKRLYDLALTADNRSSIIASPDELERIFQLDGDTRKLSENLERAIALQKQLSNYQNFHSSESNTSSPHKDVVPRTSEINDNKVNLPKDKSTTKLSSSVSLSSYSRRCDVQNNKKNSTQSFTSPDSSSNQDSGLSTPPESSDGMKHDEIDHRNHHYQQNQSNQLPHHYQTCYSSSYQTLKHKTLSNNSNSQIDHSFDTQKYDHSDSGLTRTHPQTIQSIQPINSDHRKSPINTSSAELSHSVYNDNDKQDKMRIMQKKSPVSCSSTLSSSPSTKQRINDLENGVRLLKENLENLCLIAENRAQNGNVENGKSVFNRKSCQFVSPTFSLRNSLPSSGVNNSDTSAFPHLITSGPLLNNNNKSIDVYASSELPNTSSLSIQGVYEKNLVENSNCRRTLLPPGRVYHRTIDRRLVAHGQENDFDCSSVKPQTNSKGYVKSKSNRPIIRTSSNNNSRQITHHIGNSRDFSCSRIVNSSRPNNNATHSNNGLNRSIKYHSTYQLSRPHQTDSSSSSGNSCTSSVSGEYSTDDSPTIASHISSSASSSSIDDNFNLNHSSRCKLNSKLSMPESNWQSNALPMSSVSKSLIRDEHSKSHRKFHRSSSLCKPWDSCRTPLRSVTNIHNNYGSLSRLNSVPFKKSVSSNPSNSKFVHNLTNTFGGSVPVVANLDTSYEPAHLQPRKQQSSRVYTAFDSIQRRPQVPFQPSLYFYPSTERILYSHPVQTPSVHFLSNHREDVLFSPRIPSSLNHTSSSRLKTTLCGACGGSGQVLDNFNDESPLSGRLTETPLIRPNIGLNPLYRKTLSSARTKESRARPLRATHPCDDNSFLQSLSSNLFENENTYRNIILHPVNPSTYYRDFERIDQSGKFGSLSRINKHSRSKQINRSFHTHISPNHSKHSHHSNKTSNYHNDNNNHENNFKKMENNKNIDRMYSSEDSNSSISSNDKHSNHYKQVLPMNNSNSVGKCVNQSRQQSTGSPPTSASSALQEILKAASSTSRLAQKLRCSLEDLCKTESK